MMKKALTFLLAAGMAVSFASAAEARDGCGGGFHRGPHGHCRPNGPGPVLVGPGLVIGNFYEGRGYWDGRRYWARRYAWHRGWRYR